MKIYVTYDPATVLDGAYYLESDILMDLKRANMQKLEYPNNLAPKSYYLGFDTEYSPDGKLLTVGFANTRAAIAIECNNIPLNNFISNGEIIMPTILVGHSIAGDIDYLIKENIIMCPEWITGEGLIDSLILARLVNENRSLLGKGAYSLETLMLSEFNIKPWKTTTDKKLKETNDASKWTVEERTERCRLDAWATYQLTNVYSGKVDQKLATFLTRVSMTLHRIGLAGAKVNKDTFDRLGCEWLREATNRYDLLQRCAHKLGMTEFSPTNDADLRTLFYTKLKLPITNKTPKTKLPAVDKITLKKYENHEAVKLLIEYNTYDKLASTWYGKDGGTSSGDSSSERRSNSDSSSRRSTRKSVKDLIDDQGLLHFWINMAARTGRRTSGGIVEDIPESRNAQNWPPAARKIIISRWPGGKIGSFDYKSLEPLLYAWLAEDKALHDYFKAGGYIDIAKDVLGKPVEKNTHDYTLIKNITLGVFYNMKEWKMSKYFWDSLNIRLDPDWKIHMKKISKMREKLLSLFPGVRKYIRLCKQELADTQQIVAPDGYVRHLPHKGLESEGYWHLENTAINCKVQHMASMVTGSAMIDCEAALLKCHSISYEDWHRQLLKDPRYMWYSILINEIHDELLFDMPPVLALDSMIISSTMQNLPSLRKLIPSFDLELTVDEKIQDTWG